MTQTTHQRIAGWLSAGLLVCMAGCGSADEATADVQQDGFLALQKKPAGPVVLKPNGVYFAEVTAEGTGCPAGSWNTSISSDGQVFTTTFSAYEVQIGPELANATKDCALTMKIHGSSEMSFAVLAVYYSGFALLDKGVDVRQTVRYGFHGSSADAGNSRKEFVGPYDADFVIEDAVGVDKQKWSPCGTEHTLTASTQLTMKNGTPRASGYVNMSAVDGSLKLELRLGWKGCGGGNKPAADAGTPGNGKKP
jgi:uncharacterized protein DUF4360